MAKPQSLKYGERYGGWAAMRQWGMTRMTHTNITGRLSTPALDRLVSRKQVADAVPCSIRTVARAELRGELPAIKLSPRLERSKVSDVEAWIDRSKTNTKQ